MARVITKKSTVAAKVPLATDLEIGELAVNTADAKLYTKHSDNTVKQLGITTTDSRLTDAREWTAATVSQTEAEQGTATTRRAWTAERVFQAIAAWWAASAMKTKLDGIATGATANAADAQLRDRATHTGTQAISTVTGLQTALDGKLNTTDRGVSGGVASLDEFARIPASQLPSYVDDVLEYAALANFPATGEGGKIYIAINQGTAANPTRQYRWTGSAYVEINPSPGTTDALGEGATNLYFSESRVRSTVLTGLSLASSAAVAATDSILAAVGKIQARLNLLGAAANSNVQTSPTDTTAGALMAVGAGGWMGDVPVVALANIDDRTLRGWRYVTQITAGTKPSTYGQVLTFGNTGDQVCQEFWELSGGSYTHRRWYRQCYADGAWGLWSELFHTENFNPDAKADKDNTVLQYGGSTKFQTTSAGVTITGTMSATSDRKFKSHEQVHGAEAAWSRLGNLQPKSYHYDLIGKDYTGFIAQEVKPIYPNSVDRVESEDGGHLVLTKDEIIADLVAVVQDQQRRLAKLEARHDAAQ